MNLIRKFLAFFLITSVFPIFSLWLFLYQETHSKLDERYNNLLNTAKVVVEEHLQNDLDRLQMANNQAVLLTIAEDFQKYKQTKDAKSLERALNIFQQSRNLDIVALIDSQKEIIASTDTFEYSSKDSLNSLFDKALRGESISGIEKIKFDFPAKNNVLYISVTPLVAEKDGKKILGALLVGQALTNKSFEPLKKIVPSMKVSFSSSIPSKQGKKDSVFLPIKDLNQNTVVYLQVKISRDIEKRLGTQNTFYLITYLVLLSLAILLFAVWFHRSIVIPMDEVANSCDLLSEGKEEVFVENKSATGEVKNIISSFNKMVQKLNENDQMRDNFISTLTHDLRTPLIAQARVYDLLEDFKTDQSTDFKRLVNGLKLNNTHLLTMVNSLLETYKYDSGELKLEPEKVNLKNLVDESLLALQSIAESKQITLKNEIKDSDLFLMLDSSQMKRVVINLISNAIENIPQGCEIKVVENFLNDKVEIKIIDNGSGIEPKILPYIFDKFFSHNNAKKKIGSGLGLYICKMIVEKHGGTIQVQSKIEEGSTFIINLPIAS
ncbi:MAG: ATP-binding protein [Candidatus Caenarcaniphilales bacterium]|nr:ATP-binding protein [Candidatus Caenarcaniphilales bacterium]